MIRSIRRLLIAGASIGAFAGAIWSGYLVVVTIGALRGLARGRAKTERPAAPTTRFRILVPAHNEEALIADTMRALQALDYPRELYEVHVVADNCHDATAELVRAAGFEAHERTDAVNPGKGPALGWLLDQLPERSEPDAAFVLIDADTIVDPGLLAVFDATLRSGATVVQGHYAVRDDDTGGNVGFRAAALAVRHYVRPLGRTELGGSSGLYGNGMAFRESVARANRWSDHLVEDIELAVKLLLGGGRVDFAPDATVRAEMPETLEDATSQNQRWEAGRAQVAATFVPALADAAAKRRHGRRWAYIDAILDLTLPPITTLFALTAVSGAALRLIARGRLAALGVALAIGGLGVQIGHTLLSLRLVGAPAAVYRSLLMAPVHIAWKIALLFRMLRRKGPDSWVRTTRNDETETGEDTA